LVLDNCDHHDPIQDSTDNAANDLNRERVPWRQMDVLCQLQISGKKLSLLHGVESEAGKVEV